MAGNAEVAPTFDELALALDKRLDKAIMKCGFVRPTLVQAKSLPLALRGKDLLVRARTGSGKTLAYALPLLNKVLLAKEQAEGGSAEAKIRAIVLVPTRELVTQVHQQITQLMYYCKDVVRVVALSNEKLAVQRAWLKAKPDVVVSTPGRLANHLVEMGDVLELRESVETFVVDEADLVFSFGYAEDVNKIVAQLPRTVQSMLMSATLNEEVIGLKKLVLHSPVVVKLADTNTDGKLAQWFSKVRADDKDLLLFALLRLKLISGKTLFFVNSVNRAYRVKLLLEQFHVRAAVLNSELPINSRLHILEQFNRGVFDYLIATDEAITHETKHSSKSGAAAQNADAAAEDDEDAQADDQDDEEDNSDGEDDQEDSGEDDDEKASESASGEDEEDEDESDDTEAKPKAAKTKAASPQTKKRKRGQQGGARGAGDEEEEDDDDMFGVARGFDFQNLSTVINIDFPVSVSSYTHRIGRTARGGATGTALSLVATDDALECATLEAVQRAQAKVDGVAQPALLALDLKEIEGFRYRVEDVRKAVTRRAVNDARARELKQEILNSEKLQTHFEDNPTDLALLRHDAALRPAKVSRHMDIIPDYLMPAALKEKQRMLAPPEPARQLGVNESTANRQKWKERNKMGKFRSTASKLARRKAPRGKRRMKFKNNPLF